MDHKTIRAIGCALVVGLWAALIAANWLLPDGDFSQSERRPLAQAPTLSGQTLLDGSYMKDFEGYAQDQFPLRDSLRRLKAVFHCGVLRQSDNNGYYTVDGYLENMDYALNEKAIDRAAQVFNGVYRLLAGKTDRIYVSIIPSKGYYLAQPSGHLTTDLAQMEQLLLPQIPWAQYIDLKGVLSAQDYYRTDTHWRQERLGNVAQTLCSAMGTAPTAGLETVTLDTPFYGVYYGQAALAAEPDTLRIVESPLLEQCRVYSYRQGPVDQPPRIGFHDLERVAQLSDPYDLFLHGSDQTYVVVDNPSAATDRELILFRDSYGCSLAPWLVGDYSKITIIDLRRVSPMALQMFAGKDLLQAQNADVLFLYSSLILNNPGAFQAG